MRRNHAKYLLCLKKCLCNFKHSHSQLKMVAFKIKMTKQLFFLMENCKKTSVTRSIYYEVADCGHVIWIIQMFKCSVYNFLKLMNKHVMSSQHIPTATSASIVLTLTFTCISNKLLPSTKITIYLKFNRNNVVKFFQWYYWRWAFTFAKSKPP